MKFFLRSLACLCLSDAIFPANAEATKANFPGAQAEVYKHVSGSGLYFFDTLRKRDAFLVKIGYLGRSPTEKQLSAASKRRKTKQ